MISAFCSGFVAGANNAALATLAPQGGSLNPTDQKTQAVAADAIPSGSGVLAQGITIDIEVVPYFPFPDEPIFA